MLFGEYYNNSWWYVKKYLFLMLIFPIIDVFVLVVERCNKYLIMVLGLTGCIGMVVIRVFLWHNSWISRLIIFLVNIFGENYNYIFVIAYLCARYQIFERIYNKFHKYNWFSVIGTISILFVRGIVVKNPEQSSIDVLITPFFVYFIVCILHTDYVEKHIARLLRYFGKYSTFMWLTHNFYIYYYAQDLMLWPRYSVLIFVWLVIISLVTAMLLEKIEQAGLLRARVK